MTRAMMLPFFLLLPSVAAAQSADDDTLLAFTIGGETVSGHTLTIAPVEGAPVTGVLSANLGYSGASAVLLQAAYAEDAEGEATEGISAFDWSAAKGTASSNSDAGLSLTSDSCAISASVDAPEGTIYLGIGGGVDSDGLCDSGDARGSDDFVYGQTVYYTARAAGGGGFVSGQTVYFGTEISGAAGKRVVSADLGTEYCHVGVWDDDGLVHKDTVECDEIGGYSGGGDPEREVPKDQHVSIVWSDAVNDYVTKVVWTWGGGAIDISYHYPGLAWVE